MTQPRGNLNRRRRLAVRVGSVAHQGVLEQGAERRRLLTAPMLADFFGRVENRILLEMVGGIVVAAILAVVYELVPERGSDGPDDRPAGGGFAPSAPRRQSWHLTEQERRRRQRRRTGL